MSAPDVELIYEPSKEMQFTLAAQQNHLNGNTPTLTSHNLLALTLHWIRRQRSYDALAHLYRLPKTTGM